MAVGYRIATNWTAPPLSWLNLTGTCDTTCQYVAASGNIIADNITKQDAPLGMIIDFLRPVIPNNWTDRPSKLDLTLWYQTQLSEVRSPEIVDWWRKVTYFSIKQCGQTICSKLGWKGDSDVSGLGMVISYYSLAILTIAYYIAIQLGDLPALKRSQFARTRTAKCLRGFQESVNDFLDAILVFAVAMHFAAIFRYATILDDPNSRFTVYGLFMSAFMSTFSVFPALILQTVTDRVRKHWLRIFLWLVIMACVVALEVLYSEVYKQNGWRVRLGDQETREDRQVGEQIWLVSCDNGDLRAKLEDVLTAGRVLLGVNVVWYIWYLLASVVPAEQKERLRRNRFFPSRRFQMLQRLLLAIDAVACSMMMLAFLVLFQQYTVYVERVSGGSVSKEGRWTFGQILSLATWVPIIISFISVSFFGTKSMNAKFSKRYRVIENPDMLKDPFEIRMDKEATFGEFSYSGVEGSRVVVDDQTIRDGARGIHERPEASPQHSVGR